MSLDSELSINHKQRGVMYASITCLDLHVKDLEDKAETTQWDCLEVQRPMHRVETLDKELSYHLAIVDASEEESLEIEQDTFHEYDERVADLIVCVQ